MNQHLDLKFPLWPKQRQALTSIANELVYGGAAGPGKSHLVRAAFIGWALEIPGLQLFLFRRKYKDVLVAMNGPTGFKAMLQPLVDLGVVEIVKMEIRFKNGPGDSFVGGSVISLNHCFHEDTVLDFKSYEFHVLGLEETTEFTPFQIKFLRSRVRMPDTIKIPERYLMPKKYWLRPDKPRYSFPRCMYPTNPGGPGHDYIKRGWIDCAEPYELHLAAKEDGGMLRQFIPGLLTDNPSIDPDQYAMTLSGLPPAYRDALLKGLWTAAIGSFYPEYDNERHMLPDCDLPEDSGYHFRTFDWGSSDPFCVHYWYITGEPLVRHGRYIPVGSLICYGEWYGCLDDDGSKGIGLRNEEIARGILERAPELHKKVITLADSFPFADRGGWTIEKVFADNGVILTRADDSRVQGWSQLRDCLTGVELEKGRPRIPLIYFFQSCKYIRTYLPMLQYHPSEAKPQDAQERGEATHTCFVGETLVSTRNGARRIDSLLPGDEVLAGDGVYRRISAAGLTRERAEVICLTFSDGTRVRCTPDHKFLTSKGWIKASDSVGYAAIVGECESQLYQNQFKSLMDAHISSIPANFIIRVAEIDCIAWFGSIFLERYQRAFISTISMATNIITRLKTSNWLHQRDTTQNIKVQNVLRKVRRNWIGFDILQQLGMVPKMALSGIWSTTQSMVLRRCTSGGSLYVSAAENLSNRHKLRQSFARGFVSVGGVLTRAFTKLSESVSFAERVSRPASIGQLKHARRHVGLNYDGRTVTCVKIDPETQADVYCLTEPVTHAFQLASGIVVKNCDSARYAAMARRVIKALKKEKSHLAEPSSGPTMRTSVEGILKHIKRQSNERRGL